MADSRSVQHDQAGYMRVARTVVAYWRQLTDVTQDLLLAALAAIVSLGLPALDLLSGQQLRANGVLWTVLVVVCCAALVLRRRFPLSTAAACAGVQLLGVLLRQAPVAMLVTLAAIGSAAYYADRRRTPLAVAAMGWMVVIMLLTEQSFTWSNLVWATGGGLAPVAFCYALRAQRDQVEQARQLNEARALAARAEERAQIARDVHDIVGHHLSAIRLQAVGSRKALGGTPLPADRAFDTIATLSGQALNEIRQLLGVLRDGADNDASANLDNLLELVNRMSGNDLRIRLHDGRRRAALPAGVGYCVYRVVQESLTNVARHSGARSATVRVDSGEHELVVTVDDDGPNPLCPTTRQDGSGLHGMRERVRALGGTLTAGPHTPHGWRVRATIPLGATP